MTREIRTDKHLGTVVHIVADRQNRPNLPVAGCPFCVGGLEAPEPYDVRSFPNRWPALPEGYCEVVLYSPDHEASLASLGAERIRDVVDLWTDRTTALRQQPDGEYVIVFENRGAEIGATIAHPHGQIYAFDHVPSRPLRQLTAPWKPETDPGDRHIYENEDWVIYAEFASVHPVSLRVAAKNQVADLPALSSDGRDSLADAIHRIFGALDAVYEQPLPYMMWINQSPRTHNAFPDAWLNFEIVSPWRAPGIPRYIAAVEVATEEYFNPVDPADLASRLRALL
jgi:UDPglucose--hexose-1-phosphate uridylyltransferase